MAGMSGGTMLRARRKDVNVKPNRKLDRKSSRGMLYENEELRLRTININAEVERGQTDIKKLKRENEQLRREISALRYEYERLDTMLRERSSSPQHSDDSGRSCCSACRETGACAEEPTHAQNELNNSRGSAPGGGGAAREQSGGLHVAFHDLSVVPEEEAASSDTALKSPAESADCSCETCQQGEEQTLIPKQSFHIPRVPVRMDRTVDVVLHDAPSTSTSYLIGSGPTPPPPGFHVPPPPPPGFTLSPYNQPRFHTGGNIEDLLGEVEMGPNVISTEFIQQNSVFMCNTRKITHRREPCRCQKQEEPRISNQNHESGEEPKCYVTEKNIELTYDYPRTTAIPQRSPSPKPSGVQTTTEVASTVVFVERRFPVRPKGRFDFLFRSRSAPVGENEEPIYATVNKLPKRLRRMELANLENEVAYRNGEAPRDTSHTDETEDSLRLPVDDDLSRSETEKPPPAQRPNTPKAKKRRRFTFTFKKRGERKKEKKVEKEKSGNGGPAPVVVESDNERLLEGVVEQGVTTGNGAGAKQGRKCRHMRPRTIASSVSSGPRYKRDSYQEMTSHSEHERTNSISSSINSNCSLATHKSRKLSAPPPDANIPWCGCWGTSCV